MSQITLGLALPERKGTPGFLTFPGGSLLEVNMSQIPLFGPVGPSDALGIPAYAAQQSLQSDFYKELVGKLAWAVGSTYGRPYCNRRSPVRRLAQDLARLVVTEHGYGEALKY